MKALTYSQKYLKYLLSKDKVCVDMTLGLGNDTAFLANKVKKVYSFDIQKVAIDKSKERLKDCDNIIFINDSHANIKKYVFEKVDIVMFNLGYLPYENNKVVTKADSTIKALDEVYDLLNDNGIISLIFYRGHKGGLDEYYKVTSYLKNSNYQIIDTYRSYKDPFEPILYLIKKKGLDIM